MATIASSPPEKRTVTGSCHCKAITYEAQIPKTLDKIVKCNCTMCQKPGFITVALSADGTDFTLLTPASESSVKFYQFRNKDCYRFLCDKCGVQVWGRGHFPLGEGIHRFFSVNLATIDQPQEGLDVSTLKVGYIDGLHDNWWAGTGEVPFSGGVV